MNVDGRRTQTDLLAAWSNANWLVTEPCELVARQRYSPILLA